MDPAARGITAITSRDNSKIKQVRALRQRKERLASGLFVVEGIRHVGEAASADSERDPSTPPWLEYVCFSPELLTSRFALNLIQDLSGRGIPCYSLPAELFATLAEKDNPQGILGVARQRRYDLEALQGKNFPWGVALVAPQDPGNIGAILRTIDAVGASGLILLDESADPYHPNAVRASMGAIFWYPLMCTSFDKFVSWAKANGYGLIGTSARASQSYHLVRDCQPPAILVMGSEREGLTEAQKAACDLLVQMPMRGRVSSLNLAVATGVMLYKLLDKSG